VVSFTLQLLYPQERTKVPIKWDIRWTPEPVWTFQRREKYLVPVGIHTKYREREKGSTDIKDNKGIKQCLIIMHNPQGS
jgi:c-di-GMP-binding flagellar brake protein YcgR